MTPPQPPKTPLLTLQEVGTQLHVGLRTVQAMRAAGKLKVLVLGVRCLRVEPAEVERLIRESRS